MFRFGEFTLDVSRFELRRGERKIPLQPKIVDLLHCLLVHRERVVTRAELFAQVWPGVCVGQASLNRAVRELRRALEDDDSAPRFVATVPRRGYRFVAQVEAPRPASVRASLTTTARDRCLQTTLVQASSARTLPELCEAFETVRGIVDSAGSVLCLYGEDDPRVVHLSGSHQDFISAYRPEYAHDDLLHQRAITHFDYDSSPHIAMRMPEDARRAHFKSTAYNEFYRPLGLADFICVQLTPGKNGAPGCVVLLLGRESTYDDDELRTVAWLRDILAAAVARIRRAEREDALLSTTLFDAAGHARFSAWDPGGRLLWHSERGAALLGAPSQLPDALQAALADWGAVVRGELSTSPPPPSVLVENAQHDAALARLSLGRLPSGAPVVLVDFLPPRRERTLRIAE